MGVASAEQSLRRLVDAIVADDVRKFGKLLAASPDLATATFAHGATRRGPPPALFYIKEIGHYIYAGDTALHFAAASYRPEMIKKLIDAGADVRARNRRGCEPLHSAAVGSPGSPRWDPAAQAASIACLIAAGAEPNARNAEGATPLHRAVRTRCAGAVRALLAHGADPTARNKNGSAALKLALHTTGRPGSGSSAAKAEQGEILLLLRDAAGGVGGR